MRIILFDIDGTLFDSKKFMNLVRVELASHLGVNENDVYKGVEDYYSYLSSNTDFNPHKLLEHLSGFFKTDEESLKSIFWDDKHYKEALYPETIKVLKNLQKKMDLGIFSQGFEDFQMHKLIASGILQYFNKKLYYISRKKLDNAFIKTLPNEAVVVDDRIEAVDKLGKMAIWINRNNEDEANFKGEMIKDLNQLMLI